MLLCDINMPRMDGMELLRRVHERPNPPEVIMLTGQGTIETAVEAMKNGAHDYLTKPYSINELDVRVRQAADKRRLRVDNQRLRAQIERQSALPEIVSQSQAMHEAIRLVERVAPSEASVLITGESGTGKELIAQAIHRLSNRATGSFILVDAATNEIGSHRRQPIIPALRPSIFNCDVPALNVADFSETAAEAERARSCVG